MLQLEPLRKTNALTTGARLLVGCICVLVFVACTRTTVPLTRISVPVPRIAVDMTPFMEVFGSYREGNFQNRSWTEAFLAMHQKLRREYPFTEWKAIDWDAMFDRYYPLVALAEEEQDEHAYYLALREYVHSIPDGYMQITTPTEYREAAVGGDFGFSVLPLDDGRIVVADLEADSIASLAGIRWGAEIIEWDGAPVRDALAATPLLWSDTPSATHEHALYEQCMFLTRAPVRSEVSVMFRNPDADSIWVTRLEAKRDMFQGLQDLTRQDKPFSEFESPIESRIIDEDIGYIKVYVQAPTLVTPFPARLFRRTLERFLRAGVTGIVLDLRGNSGGMDALAAEFAGHFTSATLFFHDVVAFDAKKGGFTYVEEEQLDIVPHTPYFDGPVAILVHRNTRDSAQALAATLYPLPNVFTVGALAPEGSYAYEGTDQILMPEGHAVYYPIGRMLDANGEILIASGTSMESRVVPEIRVPMTLENLEIFFRQEGDPVLDRAIEEIWARTSEP